MKECIHKKGVSCFDEVDVVNHFFDKYPDGFKNDAEFIQNIRERQKHGCEVCHFFKAGLKGSVKAVMYPLALAC